MADQETLPGRDPALRRLAGDLLAGLDAFGADLAEQIQARVDFYAEPSEVAFEDLQRSCRANADFVLHSMLDNRLADVAAAMETGRRRATQGVPLPHVMAAFRVGFSRIWEKLVERARREGISSDALVDAASDVWTVHDTFADAMAVSYRDTAMAQALQDERQRSALVAALLEGRALEEATVWDVAELLRLPRRGPFVVVAAETTSLGQEALPFVEARLRVRDIGSAWRLLPDLQVGIVHLAQPARVGVLVDALSDLARTRIGVSPAYAHLAQTASSLRLARVAMMSTGAAGAHVARFDDHPLAVAAVSSPDAMRRIGQGVLGPVLDLPPEQSSVLLQTLAAWRDNGGSVTATAKQMYCHPNTVRQRLRRLETSTSRSLADPNGAAELLLALQAVLLLPKA